MGPGIATLVVLLGVLLLARVGGRAGSARSAEIGWPPPQLADRPGGAAVFATRRGWRGIELDCMVVAGTRCEVAQPVWIEAVVPYMCGFGALRAEALSRRLADGGQLLVEIFAVAGGDPRASLRMEEELLTVAVRPTPDVLALLRDGPSGAADGAVGLHGLPAGPARSELPGAASVERGPG
jgi:hypothetical protein